MTQSPIGVSDGHALGCGLRVVTTEPRAIDAARRAVDDVLQRVDEACSRFRDDSELSRLNAAGGRPVTVSPLFASAIDLALRAAALTGGAVDPTVGRAIRLAGYDRDFAAVPPDGAAIRLVANPVPGWTAVHFDAAQRTVALPPSVELDLGATAKGMAADLAAAAALRAAGQGGVLVSIGGDIATAGRPPSGRWRVQVSEDSGEPIVDGAEAIAIDVAGVATSSTTVRTWTRGGVRLHHIIDPRTGLPADGRWRTVSVLAATCADANIASTAAIVLGGGALEWLAQARVPARLVNVDGGITRTGGWPPPAEATA